MHFSENLKEKLFWVIKAINEAGATSSIMNLNHKLYFVADANALCSILCSFGNIQIKSCWGLADSPSVALSWQKPQYPDGQQNLLYS